MRTSIKSAALGLLLALMGACGQQLVEFELDAGVTESDAGTTVGADAGRDAGMDAGITPDAGMNAGMDAGMDAGVDAGMDAGMDAGLDVIRPTVILTNPLDLAINVPIAKRVTATFSEPMNALTIDANSFKLARGLNPVPGVVSYDAINARATFAPSMPLLLSTQYTATIKNTVADLAGNTMLVDFVWSFTTGACGQLPIVLGVAGNFAVLAGSTVTNTGLTRVTGDLGVSPGSAVTGFPPGVVVGTQQVANGASAAGMFDLTAAYNDAAGRTLCPILVAGNLGGQTFVPGLYKSTGSLEISSGDLTFDAQGDADAIFIIQMASTFITTSGRQVILSGGAKASNIFWQVGTSATLGTTSVTFGTLMADQAITLETGASLTGRALARIGAVNLDTNAIVKPAP